LDLNLAFLSARPIFEMGLDAREAWFRSLPPPNRHRPSVARMLDAIDRLRKALRSSRLDAIVDALVDVDMANNACAADGLPGRDLVLVWPEGTEENAAFLEAAPARALLFRCPSSGDDHEPKR
jgi:hypothetical protein